MINELPKNLFETFCGMLNRNGGHLWAKMSPIEILKSLGMYGKDPETGKEGLIQAAILLFGKDTTILNIVPHHRTDALYRVYDADRYDDRDLVDTNLIESYDRLMAFIQKHLDNRFYLENTIRKDIRNIIGREVVVNSSIHREYDEHFYSRLIIEKDIMRTENANKARMIGDILEEENYTPKPKNPKIAALFREIGLADELGSGMSKLIKYTKAYSGGVPKLIEGDVFKTEIPISRVVNSGSHITQENELLLSDTQQKIIEIIKNNPTITQMELANLTNLTRDGIKYNISILKKLGILERSGSTKKGIWIIKNRVK